MINNIKDHVLSAFNIKLNSNLWATFISRTIVAIGYTMILPFLAVMLTKVHHMDLQEVAIIMSVYIFCQSGLMIPATFTINKIGYKNSMILGRIFGGVLYILYLYISYLPALILLSILIGFGTSLFNLATKGYLSIQTQSNPEKKFNVFSIYNMSINLGASIGPLIAAVFMTHNSFKFMLYFITIINILSIFIIERSIFNSHELYAKSSLKETLYDFIKILKNKKIYKILMITFFSQITFSQFFIVIPLYFLSTGKNLATYSILMLINTIMCLAFPFVIIHINKILIKDRNYMGLGIGSLLISFGMIFMGVSNRLWGFIVCTIIFSIGELFFVPFEDKAISDVITDLRTTTAYFSVAALGWALAKGLGSYLAIMLLKLKIGYLFWIIISSFGLIASLLSFSFYISHERGNNI